MPQATRGLRMRSTTTGRNCWARPRSQLYWLSAPRGARISTYLIFGARGSRCCVLNGAAARTCQVGDQLIICSSSYLDDRRIVELRPKILTFDRRNQIADRLTYSVTADAAGRYGFEIVGELGDIKALSLRTAELN
jgi:aspartate 1-decarboxylase